MAVFVVSCFQSGEEWPESGRGADEAQRPKLQTRPGGPAGRPDVVLLEILSHVTLLNYRADRVMLCVGVGWRPRRFKSVHQHEAEGSSRGEKK